MIRYLEVEVAAAAGACCCRPTSARVDRNRGAVRVSSILADQFADVPAIKSPDQITLLEEDKICAYYGGGTLYATPDARSRCCERIATEPVKGLPEPLPAGERMLWQGSRRGAPSPSVRFTSARSRSISACILVVAPRHRDGWTGRRSSASAAAVALWFLPVVAGCRRYCRRCWPGSMRGPPSTPSPTGAS